MTVTALLVSHDGARWLPAVLTGLSGQTLPVDRVVAVDTTSRDDSVALVARRARRVDRCVLDVVPGSTSYPAAVRHGLELGAGDRSDDEWIWLLHDDSNPEPDGARRAARRRPGAPRRRDPRPQAARVALAAPPPRGRPDHHRHRAPRDRPRAGRVRPGPARRRARGARGQHRRACSCAAPCWSRWAASTRTCRSSATTSTSAGAPRWPGTAPSSSRRPWCSTPRPPTAASGVRRSPGATPTTRSAAPPCSPRWPTCPRAASPGSTSGSSSARSCGCSASSPCGRWGRRSTSSRPSLSVHGRPRQLLAARRERADRGEGEPADVRRLLAPMWLPYRHGLDFVTDLASAATSQAADVAERRRLAKAAGRPGTGPGVREAATRVRDVGGGRRGRLPHRHRHRGPLLHQPRRRGAGALRGPRRCSPPARPSARSPAARCRRCRPPRRTGGACTSRRWHPLGTGTDVPAPAYVLPFAFAAIAPARPHRRRRVRR